MTMPAPVQAGMTEWNELVAAITVDCRARLDFLSRMDERGLQDQAGDDYRAGDAMVESMNHVARLARDRALEELARWQPPPETTLSERISGAVVHLEGLPDARHHYSRLGIAHVVTRLRERGS
jgi:hypothetical protein